MVVFLQERSALLGRLCFGGELVADGHVNFAKVIIARHQASVSSSVLARARIADASPPELLVPVVFSYDSLRPRSQE